MPSSSTIDPDHGVAAAAAEPSRPRTGSRHGRPEDFSSFLRTQDKIDAICKEHGVPKEYTALLAGDLRANATPPRGAICVLAQALEAGMRVPLHGFFSEALAHFGIAPAQLTPNGWRFMAGFLVLCRSVGVPPSLAVFRRFFKLRFVNQRQKKGWYFFQSRDSSGLQFTGMPNPNWNSFRYWKQEFFFLSSPEPEPWPCPVEWVDRSKSSLQKPVLIGEEIKSAAKLLRAHGGTAIDLRTYLSDSSLAAATITTTLPPLPPSSTCIISRPEAPGLDPCVYNMIFFRNDAGELRFYIDRRKELQGTQSYGEQKEGNAQKNGTTRGVGCAGNQLMPRKQPRRRPPVPPRRVSMYNMMKTMLAEKAAASLKKVKTEPSNDAPGSPPSYGKKRSLQEANDEERPHLSLLNTPLSSGVRSPPPGFSPKPQNFSSGLDGDTTDREPAEELLQEQGAAAPPQERVFTGNEPSDAVASSYVVILQEKLLAQERYAAELREQLEEAKSEVASAKREEEQEKAKAELAAAGAKLAKAKAGLSAAEAEVVTAKAKLTAATRAADAAAKLAAAKRALGEELDSAQVAEVHQLQRCEEHVPRRAELALERYRRWRTGRAPAAAGRAA